MNKLLKLLSRLETLERATTVGGRLQRFDARAKVAVTLLFLIAVLSLPIMDLAGILLFFIYPILMSALGEISYGAVFRRSLIALPFVLLIGVFNLFGDRQLLWTIGPIAITRGAVGFLSIVLRGLLAVQGVTVLILTTGFRPICHSLQRFGLPAILGVQLLFVYRYIFVLVREGLHLSLAREARSFGRQSATLRVWAMLVGQLLLRTFDRGERIHRAMLARGFTGQIVMDSPSGTQRWRGTDTLFLLSWCVLFVALRFFHPVESLTRMLTD